MTHEEIVNRLAKADQAEEQIETFFTIVNSLLRIAAVGYGAYLGATILLALPAHAGIVEDPVTHWKTYQPDTGYPALQPPAPVRVVDPRHPSIQIQPFSCYLIGNILQCQ